MAWGGISHEDYYSNIKYCKKKKQYSEIRIVGLKQCNVKTNWIVLDAREPCLFVVNNDHSLEGREKKEKIAFIIQVGNHCHMLGWISCEIVREHVLEDVDISCEGQSRIVYSYNDRYEKKLRHVDEEGEDKIKDVDDNNGDNNEEEEEQLFEFHAETEPKLRSTKKMIRNWLSNLYLIALYDFVHIESMIPMVYDMKQTWLCYEYFRPKKLF